jgi:hypothetical protein
MAQQKRMSGDNSDSLLNGVNASTDNTRKRAGVDSGLRVMNLSSNQNKAGLSKIAASNNKVRLPTNSEIEHF